MVNDAALKYNEHSLEALKNICEPLFKNSCISSFRYFRVLDDNSYMNLSTNHEWLFERLTKIPNNGASFHKPLCEATEDDFSFFLWEKNKKDDIVNLLIKHDIFNGITAYKRNGTSVEAWAFGAKIEDTLAPNFYINNLDILKTFIHHFNENAQNIINISDTSKLAHFGDKVSIHPVKQQNSMMQPKLKNKLFKSKNLNLTHREFECLRFLSIGKTYKETAKVMNISPRTIESYVITLKRKLNLSCKSNIIEYYWENLHLDNKSI